ncbi:MAG: hypothetical protein M1831_004158 [Alyxoria varia]|nr:MAG: hypothetical protein M1831_004158 [Alyxoria varia]
MSPGEYYFNHVRPQSPKLSPTDSSFHELTFAAPYTAATNSKTAASSRSTSSNSRCNSPKRATPPSSRRGSSTSLARPTESTVFVGQFLHLPARALIPTESVFNKCTTADRNDVYDHPIIVVGTGKAPHTNEPTVFFKTCTSHHTRPLGVKYSGCRPGVLAGRNRYWLVDHSWNRNGRNRVNCMDNQRKPDVQDFAAGSWSHPDGRPTLRMRDGSMEFEVPTYVNFEGKHEIEVKYLQWQRMGPEGTMDADSGLDDGSVALLQKRVIEQDAWELEYGCTAEWDQHKTKGTPLRKEIIVAYQVKCGGPEPPEYCDPDVPSHADLGALQRFWNTDNRRDLRKPQRGGQRNTCQNLHQPQSYSTPPVRTNNNQYRQNANQAIWRSQEQCPWKTEKNWRETSPENDERPNSAVSDTAYEFQKRRERQRW